MRQLHVRMKAKAVGAETKNLSFYAIVLYLDRFQEAPLSSDRKNTFSYLHSCGLDFPVHSRLKEKQTTCHTWSGFHFIFLEICLLSLKSFKKCFILLLFFISLCL